MKYFLGIMIFFSGIVQTCSSQEVLYLNEIDESTIEKLKSSTLKFFAKEDCYNKRKDYDIILEFGTTSKIELDSFRFSSKKEVLNNLFLQKKTNNDLNNNVRRHIFLVEDEDFHASSDHKSFYCNSSDNSLKLIYNKFRDGLDKVEFVFWIYNTDGFLYFIMLNNEDISVFNSSTKVFLTLEEFNEKYINGEINKFTSNPF